MHEILKYFILTEIQKQCLNPMPGRLIGPGRPADRVWRAGWLAARPIADRRGMAAVTSGGATAGFPHRPVRTGNRRTSWAWSGRRCPFAAPRARSLPPPCPPVPWLKQQLVLELLLLGRSRASAARSQGSALGSRGPKTRRSYGIKSSSCKRSSGKSPARISAAQPRRHR